MTEILENLYKHARGCPVTCLLQLLCLYNFFIAVKIAVLQQTGISDTLYILLLASYALLATLAIAMNRNCRLNMNQDARDT